MRRIGHDLTPNPKICTIGCLYFHSTRQSYPKLFDMATFMLIGQFYVH